jgi:hypothetical protein
MARDFYATVAQVLPVLLLALVWESRYYENLRQQRRVSRREDPVHGVRFWTKPWIRRYALTVATVAVADTGACVLVLAGTLPDSLVLRGLAAAGLLLPAVSLLYRVWADIVDATTDPDDPPPPVIDKGFPTATTGDVLAD